MCLNLFDVRRTGDEGPKAAFLYARLQLLTGHLAQAKNASMKLDSSIPRVKKLREQVSSAVALEQAASWRMELGKEGAAFEVIASPAGGSLLTERCVASGAHAAAQAVLGISYALPVAC